jgi:hypothetical protein
MVAINFDLKVIFFHVPKTAGSYIQKNLGQFYGFKNYNDISRYDNILNNIQEHMDESNILLSTNPWSDKTLGINKYFSTSTKIIKMIGLNKEMWDNMFKFTFVRDPYSRFISSWNFVINGFKHKNTIIKNSKLDKSLNLSDNIKKYNELKYFIENKDNLTGIAYNHVFVTQTEHILNENNINNMDFIGKMENLEDDLKTVLNKFGINDIIHKKEIKVNKTEHEYYKSYYDQEILDFVNTFFHDDFKNYNYRKYETIDQFLQE